MLAHVPAQAPIEPRDPRGVGGSRVDEYSSWGQLFDRFDDLRGAHVEKRNSPRRLLNCGAQATPG